VINLKPRIVKTIIIAAIASIAVVAVHSLEFLQRNEWIAYDQFVAAMRRDTPAPEEVVVILVDDASLQFMDPLVGRWPWPRSVFGDVIDYIAMGDPQSIIFDVLFVERQLESSASSLNNDQRLVDATATAGNVIHAMQFIRDNADEFNRQALNPVLPSQLVERHKITDPSSGATNKPFSIKLPAYNNFLVPIEGLSQNAAALGVVAVESDPDGILRRTPLLFRYQNALFPSLSLAPLTGQGQSAIEYGDDYITVAGTKVPLDNKGRYLVNFYPTMNTFSMSGVLSSITALNNGNVENIMIHPDEFRGKHVFIGSSAVGLHDLKTTSLGSKQPGVYLQASVLANLLHHEVLSPPRTMTTWLSILLASLITALGVLFLKQNLLKVSWPVAVAAFLGIWCYWQFANNQVVAVVQPLMAVVLSGTLAFTYLLFTEGREKNKIRKMFSQYVSPAALSAMIDNYGEYKNADTGSKEIVTMLFSDIRGFTSLSESLPAEKVVEMLNFYFSNMTTAVLEHHGTIDKFIGDAIMATWGAPIKSDTHANDAVRAGLAMIEKLHIVNQWLEQHDLQPIDIGIGIHTGEVILGSIGSEQKADYTVIGDNVNLASRLEGATKTYGCRLILSEKTYERLSDLPCVPIDMIRVKGKQQPVKIFTPLSLFSKDQPDVEVAKTIEQAFDAYLKQDWEDAIARFSAFPNRRLGELYVNRCRQFKAKPPPADWDGVYTMENK
jgi:adenylate cyclase